MSQNDLIDYIIRNPVQGALVVSVLAFVFILKKYLKLKLRDLDAFDVNMKKWEKSVSKHMETTTKELKEHSRHLDRASTLINHNVMELRHSVGSIKVEISDYMNSLKSMNMDMSKLSEEVKSLEGMYGRVIVLEEKVREHGDFNQKNLKLFEKVADNFREQKKRIDQLKKA